MNIIGVFILEVDMPEEEYKEKLQDLLMKELCEKDLEKRKIIHKQFEELRRKYKKSLIEQRKKVK